MRKRDDLRENSKHLSINWILRNRYLKKVSKLDIWYKKGSFINNSGSRTCRLYSFKPMLEIPFTQILSEISIESNPGIKIDRLGNLLLPIWYTS